MPGAPSDLLDLVEAAYREHFEVVPDRASVSFLGVEPLEVLRYPDEGADHYVTLGMARYPMGDPAETTVATSSAPRAELLVTVAGRPERLWRALAVMAAGPAVEGAVYQPGNRLDLGEPLSPGSRCTGAVLAVSELRPIVVPGVADVQVLRLLPATPTELAYARVHGSEQLRQRWQASSTDLTDLMRDPVELG
ncbi:MAG: suppressor of fused domain protein [Actinobacteria bacterium]|nr:suppressor of fused domain protein [Actinomycetota bacterium]